MSDLEQIEFDASMCCLPKNIGMLFFKHSLQVSRFFFLLAAIPLVIKPWNSARLFLMKFGTTVPREIRYNCSPWNSVKLFLLKFGTTFPHEIWYNFSSWNLVQLFLMKFVQLFLMKFGTTFPHEIWYNFSSWNLVQLFLMLKGTNTKNTVQNISNYLLVNNKSSSWIKPTILPFYQSVEFTNVQLSIESF